MHAAEHPDSAGHPQHAPALPQVVDEAGDSPSWVPALGFGLFVLVAIAVGAHFAGTQDAGTGDTSGAIEAVPAQPDTEP